MPKRNPQEQGDTATVTKAQKKLQKPKLYKVVFHNDDYTTREFVVFVLQTVFHHDEHTAERIMWHVHTQGKGVAGVFTFEIAESRAHRVEELAQANEFPLRVTVEPEDDT